MPRGGNIGAEPEECSNTRASSTSLEVALRFRRAQKRLNCNHQHEVLRTAGEVDDGEADAEALEAVENLLESYFVQIDGTFDKLEAIGAPLSVHPQFTGRGSMHFDPIGINSALRSGAMTCMRRRHKEPKR